MTEVAEWQHGIDLDRLKALAAPFRERHKALVFGAFGLTKERDVAEAMSKNRLLWTGAPPVAVALIHQLQRPSEQQDFAQRPFTIPAGAIMVKAFAALDVAAGTKVLKSLIERAATHEIIVEIFEEDDVARQCVAALGLAHVATKISAGSEIKGIYALGRPIHLAALDQVDEAGLEILDPAFAKPAEVAAVQAEMAAADEKFAQHYSDYNKRKSWTAFALRGYSDDPSFIIKPGEMSKAWKEEHPAEMAAAVRWTPAAAEFPAAMALVGKVQVRADLRFDRVRFMRLRSKDGELSRHADITDREAGTADGCISRLHIPIRTSSAVTFRSWSARGEKLERVLPQGALVYLDQRKPHAVTNKDPALDRIHLVMDVFADTALRALITRGYAKRARAAA